MYTGTGIHAISLPVQIALLFGTKGLWHVGIINDYDKLPYMKELDMYCL